MTLVYQQAPGATQKSNRMLLSTTSAIEVVDLSSIIYLQAFDSSCRVYFTNRPPMLSLSPMRDLVQKLDPRLFFQCHKSYAVNLKHLQRYLRDGDLVLSGDVLLPLARRRKVEFITRLEQFYEG